MADQLDWRLCGQHERLKGVALRKKKYHRYSETWTHDHCSFCWATFSEDGDPEDLVEGYATLDDYYWVCEECFKDFRDLFDWQLAPPEGDMQQDHS